MFVVIFADSNYTLIALVPKSIGFMPAHKPVNWLDICMNVRWLISKHDKLKRVVTYYPPNSLSLTVYW